MGWDYEWAPYVPVGERKAQALRALPKLLRKGEKASPVVIKGTKIATSFWGKSWCQQLEAHSDFSNRLPRGRTYARNGSVVHLRIEKGLVEAVVSGSEVYKTAVKISPLKDVAWKTLVKKCQGQVSSVVELLQGRLPKTVLEAIADRDSKLFPQPSEMTFSCSCPDGARMCKHVAAVLYGVGARLDEQPEIFFTLRGADWNELIAVDAAASLTAGAAANSGLAGTDLSGLFGIDLEEAAPARPARAPAKKPLAKKPPAKKAAKTKPVVAATAARRGKVQPPAVAPAPAPKTRPAKTAAPAIPKTKPRKTAAKKVVAELAPPAVTLRHSRTPRR